MCHNSHTEDRKHARKDSRTRTRSSVKTTHLPLGVKQFNLTHAFACPILRVQQALVRQFITLTRKSNINRTGWAWGGRAMHPSSGTTHSQTYVSACDDEQGTLWKLRPSLAGIYSSSITLTISIWLNFCKTFPFSCSNDLKFVAHFLFPGQMT